MKLGSIWAGLLLAMHLACALTYENALKALGKDGLLHITDKNYKQLVKNEDFALVVFLTAEDSRVGCTLCHQFAPQYKTTAYQYVEHLKNDDKARVIFAFSDFLESKDYFQMLGLTAVPRLFYYEPGKGPQMSKFSSEFSFVTAENTDGFQRWVSSAVPRMDLKSLQIETPASKSILFTLAVFVLVLASVGYKFKNHILDVVQSRRVWEFLSFGLIVLFISGYMYNQIRSPETYKKDKDGNIVYFATGHNTQYAAETQVVSLVYGLVTICLGLLLKFLPSVKDVKKRFIGVITISVIVFFLYSYLVEIYALKSPGYPLRLLKRL
ncbi:hypothetical protein PICMEDRAFT_52302 [Pichia membranifaciens NRRL Y-2026]|uniref:Thioredoxin domain-containing protein n=1 Tax=Pichia membranifaciens NRRL Y-2026 TaxID=763406 RepID=A0A1E3NKB6_9ASCO|nr:hypothetical protein PICMEDRAFT_52302 [Pichia membranifaciens NRRL Y-2026]ODQ46584.1 hypothetical protein PICMEDRAFT_52302 [Pichia membranifaciens NRRL Y-2026]